MKGPLEPIEMNISLTFLCWTGSKKGGWFTNIEGWCAKIKGWFTNMKGWFTKMVEPIEPVELTTSLTILC